MYLKSIELQGFKSFPDKTTLTVNKGITVVIGPNGSGKSNIADAVRWVLGEVSSKNIRGTKMEDVIFGGCETRKPGTYAQVSLTLDNTSAENRLDIDYNTVTVTRRYFRGGDSDYLINGKSVRLKDIHRLFMNTGIGRGGYSVIGQGKIAEIISQKSEERRNVFEEAAGISKYKFSKAEAGKKLAGVNDNLTRVCDIASELGARVEPLERASEKARKYLVLYDEKKQLDISLWLYDMAQSSENIAKLKGNYELYKAELEQTEEELSKLESKVEELFAQSQQNKYQTECANEKLTGLIEEKTGHGGRMIQARTQAENIDVQLAELKADIETLNGKISELIGVQTEKEKGLGSLKEKHKEALMQCSEANASYEQITQKLAADSARADATVADIERLRAETVELRIKLSVLDEADKSDTEQNTAADEEEKQRISNIDGYSQKAERCRKTCDEYAQKQAQAQSALDGMKVELDEKTRRRDEEKEKSSDIYVKISTLSHRADNLRKMAELLEGYSHSVRFVMDEYKSGKIKTRTGGVCPQIYAPVSMLISVPTEYACAVETSLGAAMQNIVVENEEAAKSAMYHLKRNNAGRCTFCPISTVKPQYLNYRTEELAKNDGFVGVASDLVSYDGKFSGIIKNLLGRTVVFSDIDKANIFAKKYDFKIRIVTLDGQQINAGGSFTGGSSRAESGMLSRAAELEKIDAQTAELKTRREGLEKSITSINGEITSLTAKTSELEGTVTILATLLTQEQAQLQIIESQLTQENDRLRQLKESADDMEKREMQRAEQRAECERLLVQTEAEIEQALQLLKQIEDGIEKDNAAQESYRVRGGELVARISGLESEVNMAEENYNFILSQRQQNEAQREQTEHRIEQLEAKKTELLGITSSGEESLSKIEKGIEEARVLISSLSAQNTELETKLTSARNAEREKSRSKELLTREFTQVESKLSSAEEARVKLTAFLSETYELSYSEAKELAQSKNYPTVTVSQRPELVKRQTELKNKIRALGDVNVNSIEEYKEVKDRYDFMTAQIEDLQKSRVELESVIYKLEEEMKAAFADSFEQINAQFKKTFVRLFGGGSAELILKDPDDLLNTGIEINAAPPGKIIKSLSLLSGGEQSFVAIALYFALLAVNPTPFILLDEIDSALDEVNVDRFGDYISEGKGKTQFILISHRRGTMESADMLYGVTMPTKGISKVLSVNVDEIEQKIGKLN